MFKSQSKFPSIIAITASLLALNLFSIKMWPGIGLSLFLLTLIVCLFLHVLVNRDKNHWLTWATFVTGALAALMPALTANEFVQALDYLVYAVSLVVLLGISSFKAYQPNLLWLGRNLFKALLNFLPHTLSQLAFKKKKSVAENIGDAVKEKIAPLQEKKQEQKNSIFKAVLVSIVLLMVFGGILMSADPVFQELASDFLSTLRERAILSLVLWLLIVAFVSFKFKPDAKKFEMQSFSFIEIIIPVLSLSILFALFILVQIQYLFAGHQDFASFGITYSDYVRQGFQQLLIASFLGEVIVYLVYLKQKHVQQLQQKLWLKIANSVLIGELFFVLLSALKRDLLYIDAYGLSRIRIIGGVFLGWLAIVLFLFLLVCLMENIKQKIFIHNLAVTSVLAVVVLNVINMDVMVYSHMKNNPDHFDHFYLSALSPDVAQGWIESVQEIEEKVPVLLDQVAKNGDLMVDEETELANYKLALVKFADSYQNLTIQYEPNRQEALEAYCKKEYWNDNSRYDLEYRAKCMTQEEEHEEFEDLRDWRAFNLSEYQAYRQLKSTELRPQVLKMIRAIEDAQVDYDLSLYKHMREKVFDYDMPFVNFDRRIIRLESSFRY